MRFQLCLFVVACSLLLGTGEAGNVKRDSQDQRDNMEHLFPLLFMMGGAPSVCGPAVWLVGVLSLAVVWLVGQAPSMKS